ncbi:MAG TPA: alpha-glucuronidase family glycosyl hydrolase [Gemmatimonadales bacterium]|nr:alpha-glucuronidase family glycosyl hydrolase [Gemmatimonadales bacterium]
MRGLARWLPVVLGSALLAAAGPRPPAEDGYELWLRYRVVDDAARLAAYRSDVAALTVGGDSPALRAARAELLRGLGGLLGRPLPVDSTVSRDGTVLIGTPAGSPAIASLGLGPELARAGREGYVLRTARVRGRRVIVVAANRDAGVLYGAFHLLRLIQTGRPLDSLAVTAAPRVSLRVLDHWDNLDGTVTRGYAGASLWTWESLPGYLAPRYRDYARADASIGINGVVLNNVNGDARFLTAPYLEKVAALAGVFRPYGIRVFLAARFSAPVEVGGLRTADPLDAAVQAWWRAKADEIYRAIPDFGGFLVKANSEGEPGPQDYHRTHAQGANLLADALAPHGGVVMWRAFVYAAEIPTDRVKQAYDEFVPLDGKFRANVLVQVKNGPLDFQPREPFHPLFGAMPRTPVMLELQVTKEYLGQDTHLAYLGTMWQEVLDADTYARGPGSTVARIVDGSLFGHRLTGVAGVANVGSDRNWCGSIFNQANWYAFGRMAWDPGLGAAAAADEWIRQTFSNDTAVVRRVTAMMLASREAVVNYMTPLGLAHQMAYEHHYGPGPWVSGGRPDWMSVTFNRADAAGIGFDRTPAGSDAVAQYFPPLRQRFASPDSVPENLLLWFHHLPWTARLTGGRTLWEELLRHYQMGIDTVRWMLATWDSLAPRVDPARFDSVRAYLAIQAAEARWWRDASVVYWQSLNQLPIPAPYAAPLHTLEFYQRLGCPADVRKPRCPAIEEKP